MSQKWIKDSIACNGARKLIYYDLLKCEHRFIGKNIDKIENVLGKPNVKQSINSETRFYYFVEGGIQCLNVSKEGYDSVSVEVLFVFFNSNNVVKSFGGMKP